MRKLATWSARSLSLSYLFQLNGNIIHDPFALATVDSSSSCLGYKLFNSISELGRKCGVKNRVWIERFCLQSEVEIMWFSDL